MSRSGLDTYIIRGGEAGRSRLGVLARVMSPTTDRLLDDFGTMRGFTVIDAGCGGGDVTFDLAARVGPDGSVHGIDLDDDKLTSARREADERGLSNVTFHKANVLDRRPIGEAQVVYARFVLTHVVDALGVVGRARESLAPGGLLIVEDIDFEGHFCEPPCRAFERYRELYTLAGQKRGADPLIGRRLGRILSEAGLEQIGTSLVQPFGNSGEVKQIASLTFSAISSGLVQNGLATDAEVEEIRSELETFAKRPDTLMSLPRIFQAWARRDNK